jgi:hypothetical protein
MSAPPAPFGGGLLLDQVLVGGAASLLNLIIHASLLGAVVWAVRRLGQGHLRAGLPAIYLHDRLDRDTARGGAFPRSAGLGDQLRFGRRGDRVPISSISPSAITRRSAMAR